ncbi:unnamed protein product, partial [Laminaria digitata]
MVAGKTDTDELVEASLKRAGLWEEVKDRLAQPGTSLSGGQQQRLCIARAIAVSPQVILMDEPCSALDPIATARIEELIDELRQNFTIVIVTHSMQQAARVSQKTAFFHLGELVEQGNTELIFTNPVDKRTQDYITGLQIERSIESLQRRNTEEATQIIEDDARIDALQIEIEELAIQMIARRQPLATDLRATVAGLKIAPHIERIGDYAKNIARRTIALNQNPPIKPMFTIPRMGRMARSMVKDVLDAFSSNDLAKARAVWERDAELDDMYDSLFRELLTYMMEDPRSI